MGTLLDCNRQSEDHKWGPPREAPATAKVRGKRGRICRARTPPVKNSGKNKAKSQQRNLFTIPVSPLAKEPNSKRRCFQEACFAIEASKEDDDESDNDTSPVKNGSGSEGLIECPKPDCGKKFRDLNALKFHLSYSHNELKAQHDAAKAKQEKEEQLRAKAEEADKENETEDGDKTEKDDCNHVETLTPTQQQHHRREDELTESDSAVAAPSQTTEEGKTETTNKVLNGIPHHHPSETGLNLTRGVSNHQQVSPAATSAGRATAVVKPLLPQQYSHDVRSSSPYKPPNLNGSLKRAASPVCSSAYSDISDEESDAAKPLSLQHPSNSAVSSMSPAGQKLMPQAANASINFPSSAAAAARGINVKPEFHLQRDAHKPNSQSIGPPPPPTSLGSFMDHLTGPPGSLRLPPTYHYPFPSLPPGTPGMGGPPPAHHHQAMAAAMAAALGHHGGPPQSLPADLFDPRGPRSSPLAAQALDILHQQATAAARQYIASTKLQELQERAAINFPFAVSSPSQSPRLPQSNSGGIYTTSSANSSPVSTSSIFYSGGGNLQLNSPSAARSGGGHPSSSSTGHLSRLPAPAHMNLPLGYPMSMGGGGGGGGASGVTTSHVNTLNAAALSTSFPDLHGSSRMPSIFPSK